MTRSDTYYQLRVKVRDAQDIGGDYLTSTRSHCERVCISTVKGITGGVVAHLTHSTMIALDKKLKLQEYYSWATDTFSSISTCHCQSISHCDTRMGN